MKKVRVSFKTPNGNAVDRFINTSSSVKKAVITLANDMPKEWKVISSKVDKEFL